MEITLPTRIVVKQVMSSRYGALLPAGDTRPLDWDLRKEGIDVVETTDGTKISLFSDGQQSVPQPGWVLLLTSGDPERGYRYTLYGMPKGSPPIREWSTA